MILDIILLVAGIALVLWGADRFTDSASNVARRWNVSELVIGLTIVAFGTSLPELVTSVSAARKGNADIAIGNIVGSNIFNILFIIGTTALITPVIFVRSFVVDTLIAAACGLLLFVGVVKNRELKRPIGIVMLLCYVAYFVYLL